ncbi:hypothetical protein [Shewanella sp.]|uniref:hypothetical protein n=1 Tax=Shewanella sp. TaxID=50422 RepID=UPI0025852606|nr:hypothetical protein [Shewanella sp.]MCJ8305126.1 hypothetical protein [Shewanella sp.]NQY27669.1 hypothetical protein [Piscirickettsiaceae bacterium]
MKTIKWILTSVIILVLVATYWFDGFNREEIVESELVAGMCQKEEKLDRWLLQQTWFHSEQFSKIAMVFDHVGFSLYKKDEPIGDRVDGAFCINGNDLIVRYYKTSFVPNSFEFSSFSDWSIKLGRKTKPLGEDIFTVNELTKNKITIRLKNDNREYVFYRKN